MAQAPATRINGWALAIRQRRSALAQRLCVGVSTGMVLSPLLGWALCGPWIALYLLAQAVELWAFGPINNGRAERMSVARSVAGCAALTGNTLVYGLPTLWLWAAGGAMGGLCAVIMLSAAILYSMINAPLSVRVVTATLAPHFLYLGLTPLMMVQSGAPSGYASTTGAAIVIFGAYTVIAWQRMSKATQKAHIARTSAEQGLKAAEAAMADRSAFLAAVAHDLRTPISAILTGASELERLAERSPARAHASLIGDAGLMMKAMLDDLLDHTKLDAGRMTVELADMDLRALLAQTVYLWRGPVREKGLILRFEGANQTPAMVRGDAMRLRQVLNNLISNAIKFTPDGAVTITVRSWPEEPGGHALLIEVSDTGLGMSPAQVTRLFTPFDQTADGVSARYGGTGLGLAISRNLVELMGGRLTVRSRQGRGASFTVSIVMAEASGARPAIPPIVGEGRGDIVRALGVQIETPQALPTLAETPVASPIVAPELEAEPELQPEPQPALEAEVDQEEQDRPLSVLVVDDHEINRRAVELILAPLGCEIATAADGLAALRLCEVRAFDVIFMDVRMPELDGRETTRRLRAGGGMNAQAPVIAVTADTGPDDVAACHAAGMNYFVSKPLTPATLLGALNAVLSGAAADETAETVAA